jgi:hypothetical protein
LNTSTQRCWFIRLRWPPAPMVAFSRPSPSSVACTNCMPNAHRPASIEPAPIAASSRSGSKVLNMNSTHPAALRCNAGSSAST